jgi:hypothetical protein
MAPPARYLDPSATISLRDGIAELRASERDDDLSETVASDLKGDLHIHDAIHVLFACPTTVAGEVQAHAWTLFGTTVARTDAHRVMRHGDHRKAIAAIGHFRLLTTWLSAIPMLLGVYRKSRAMSSRWPAERLGEFLDLPLDRIRHDYRIRVASAAHPARDS